MSIVLSRGGRATAWAMPYPRADVAVPVILTGVGLLLWAVSLGRIDLARRSDYGLLPALPATWFAAVALLLGAAAAASCQRRSRPALIALATAGLVVVLYGTVPAVSDVPQYFWTYKHIGVTRYIGLHGAVSPDVDIYHRWPGFFAVSAVFSWLAGRGSPVDYAGWAEVFFPLVCTAAVAALGRRLLGDARLGQLAGLLFALTNWVGQSYFAPQAFAFTLMLGIFVLLVDHFVEPRPNRCNRLVLGVAGVLVRRHLTLTPRPAEAAGTARAGGGRVPRATVVALVVLLQAAVVASHQLTPYMLVLGVAGLTVLGLVRPWWIVVILGVVAVAYLLPNLGYVQSSFGLFSGVDPIANVRTQGAITPDPMPGKIINGLVGQLLCVAVWLLAALGAVRWARGSVTADGSRPIGDGRVLVPLVLALAAGGLIMGQNYGGEGILRVVLFSLPWSTILAARALAPGPGRRWRPRRALVVLPVTCVLAALFVPAFHGQAAMNILPPDEIRAAEHLYDAGTPGAAIVTGTPDFPVKLAGDYDRFGPAEQNVPALLDRAELRGRPLGRGDVDTVSALLDGYGRESYLIFATSQETYADIYRIAPPGALHSLEAALADSGRFDLWYSTPNTRIYRYQSTDHRAPGVSS